MAIELNSIEAMKRTAAARKAAEAERVASGVNRETAAGDGGPQQYDRSDEHGKRVPLR